MMEEYVTYTQEKSDLQTLLFFLWAVDAVMNIKIGIKIMVMLSQYYYSFYYLQLFISFGTIVTSATFSKLLV